jgi:thiol-disulfide isomerase/thioredoxin
MAGFYSDCVSIPTSLIMGRLPIIAVLLGALLQVRALDGAIVRPFEPAGAANVLLFVGVDCPISNGYAPEIQRICAASASKGVQCLLVYEDPGLTPAAARAHAAEYRYASLPVVVDGDGSIAARAGATVTPETAVVDRGGAVRYRGRIDNKYVALGRARRTVTVHDLAGALDAIAAGTPVTAPETQAVGCAIVPPEMRRKTP